LREQFEVNRQSVLGPEPIGSGSRSLRLLQPWAPDDAERDGHGPGRADSPARRTSHPRHLALVSAVELELARPTAMVVMCQLLDAWRSAERQLAATMEGSLERPQIQTEIATLRALYQGLFARVRHGQAGTGGY
jgi:hypothetical protein